MLFEVDISCENNVILKEIQISFNDAKVNYNQKLLCTYICYLYKQRVSVFCDDRE